MRNRISAMAVIAILMSTKTGSAQSKADSSFQKKNELSIDLLPVLKVFSDMDQNYNYRGTLQYKRRLSKHVYFRFGFTLIKRYQAKKYSDPYVQHVDYTYDRVNFNQYIFKPEVQFNPGIEYRWGKKRLTYFTGFDIGYSHTETIYRQYEGLVDNYFQFDPNAQSNSLEGSFKKRDFHEIMTSSEMTVEDAVCFTPFYGMQYHFSKRFFFSLQLGIQLHYIPKYKRTYLAEPTGIINNFSLGFRF
jgi:hypothetical protein